MCKSHEVLKVRYLWNVALILLQTLWLKETCPCWDLKEPTRTHTRTFQPPLWIYLLLIRISYPAQQSVPPVRLCSPDPQMWPIISNQQALSAPVARKTF